MKKFGFFVVLFVFLITISFSQNNQDFNSPEILMQYFVENLREGNIENVFLTSPFSNDSLIKRINPRESIVFFNAFLPQDYANFPTQYYQILKYNFLGLYSIHLKRFITNLLLPAEFSMLNNYKPLSIFENGILNEELLDNYFILLDLENLRSLELIRFDVSNPELQFNERSRRLAEILYKNIYGCDDVIEYTVLYRCNENYYVGGITLVCYDINWYIFSLKSDYGYFEFGSLRQVPGVFEYLFEYNIESQTW